MFTRQARKNEEVWLMEQIEERNLDDESFRSREYTFLFDEDTKQRPMAFGRARVHRDSDNPDWGEFTSLATNSDMSLPQLLPQLIHGLNDRVRNEGLDDTHTIYVFTENEDMFKKYGFETVEREQLRPMIADRLETKEAYLFSELKPMQVTLGELHLPDITEETPEDDIGDIQAEKESLGYSDDDELTYKYST